MIMFVVCEIIECNPHPLPPAPLHSYIRNLRFAIRCVQTLTKAVAVPGEGEALLGLGLGLGIPGNMHRHRHHSFRSDRYR